MQMNFIEIFRKHFLISHLPLSVCGAFNSVFIHWIVECDFCLLKNNNKQNETHLSILDSHKVWLLLLSCCLLSSFPAQELLLFFLGSKIILFKSNTCRKHNNLHVRFLFCWLVFWIVWTNNQKNREKNIQIGMFETK